MAYYFLSILMLAGMRDILLITTHEEHYGDLNVEVLGQGFTWLDTGTRESLLEMGMFEEIIAKRQGFKIACLEEIASNNGFLSGYVLTDIGQNPSKNSYGQYLLALAEEM